jgi:hypothetical protein
MSPPDAMHRAVTGSHVCGQGPGAPISGIAGLGVQVSVNDLFHHVHLVEPLATAPGLFFQAFQSLPGKPLPPQSHRMSMDA